jgi:hypothetical protein
MNHIAIVKRAAGLYELQLLLLQRPEHHALLLLLSLVLLNICLCPSAQAEVVSAYTAMPAAVREERITSILPETPVFCAFVEALASKQGLEDNDDDMYILHQMLKLARMVRKLHSSSTTCLLVYCHYVVIGAALSSMHT